MSVSLCYFSNQPMKRSLLLSRRSAGRRVFLRQAAIAGAATFAAPAFLSTQGLAAEGKVAPSNRIAIGIIGTGRQSVYANIPGFLQQPDAQIVAVCDVDSWRLEKARQQVEDYYARERTTGMFKGCAALRDWRALIARPDIDAVMIATPDHWHALMAVAALKAGKDVACEKPLTRNIAEGRRISDCVIECKRVFRTDSEFRSIEDFRRAAQLVRNGKIGRLQRIFTGTPKDSTLEPQPAMKAPPELDYDLWLGPAPEKPYSEKRVHPPHETKGRPGWICIRDYADGMLANWGAHLNDIAMWANNTEHEGPVEIEATGVFPPQDNLWNVIQEFEAHFRFANGVNLICKTDKPYVRFEGTEGWILVNYGKQIETEPESLALWKPGPQDLVLPAKTSEKRDFLDAVKSRQQPLYDAETGHRIASLSHLALASITLGRKLRWDGVAEKVTGDEQANQLLLPKPMRSPWKI
jgi:myo-inositol 2-dehydrogenase / D-chiro-inositol 1-dehydrogenase